MFYLSGNTKNGMLGVVDSYDNVEEFYTSEFLRNLRVKIIRFNEELEVGYTFRTKCFEFTLIEENNIRGWRLVALPDIDTFRNKANYLGYPVISLEDCFRGCESKKLNLRSIYLH